MLMRRCPGPVITTVAPQMTRGPPYDRHMVGREHAWTGL